jgi:hypothetical protein
VEAYMKKAVNLRLEDNIIITLRQSSKELKTTKTDIIEKSIKFNQKIICYDSKLTFIVQKVFRV